uniref:Uncharacterized protein n=1 Tax=Candidatus Kentrum sp. MB TaxID=2138164 RepID=A0A451B8U9_9GAMM|nr:MAG: hypothetical protein BECKMB1821G_GA0114241_101321 [Candidatus Kentron sp. MB]VFK29150.1 MAG: hypothetical protein BECKMB1821I_GA0114274_100855 [Candidatus Kentron sp. MB]VFK74695.1 MAG: hypothetical protein BECKMB1821H_GA0114242_100854 [Candidatus Kentron sp. MB]
MVWIFAVMDLNIINYLDGYFNQISPNKANPAQMLG